MKAAATTRQEDAVLGELIERYRGALVSVALDRIGRFDVAEEIAQQALVAAWEHRASLRDPAALGSWLYRIASNCCAQWQRREDRWVLPDAAGHSPGERSSGMADWERRETIREVRVALAELPSRNRVALLMHLYGYSYAEIAAFLNLRASTIRGRIARARDHLKRSLIRRLGSSVGAKGDEQR